MRLPLFFFIFFIQINTFSQQWLGVAPSNYSGTYGIYSNPANVADSRYKIFVNLAGANLDFINNYFGWGAPYSLIGLITNKVSDTYRAPNGAIIFRNSYADESLSNKTSTVFMATDLKGPALMLNFNKAGFAVGLTSRFRLLANMNNVTTPVARVLVNGTLLPDIYGVPQDNNHFTMNMNGYAEMGLTLGKIIWQQDEHFLKAGLTLKRVNGVMNIHYIANDLDYTIDDIPARPRKQNVFFENAAGTYGLTKSGSIQSVSLNPNWLFGNASAGHGYGVDVGVVYEYRPEHRQYDIKTKKGWTTDATKNKYLYKISLALLDFGQIRFNNSNYVYQTNIAKTKVLIPPGTFNKIDSPEKLFNQMNNAFGLKDADYDHEFASPLPTALSANFDYKFSEKLYLNATWIQNLRNTKTIGMNQPSMLAFVPRLESKWLELSLPIALQNNYHNLTVGLAGRLGPLFIGTDNLAGVLNIGKPKGISAYFGLFLPIFNKLPEPPNPCYSERKAGWGQGIRDILQKNKRKRQWRRIR